MNFTIRKKLLAGFLGVIILLGMISSMSYVQIQQINNSYSDLVERRSVILMNAKDMQIYASRAISGLRGALLEEEGQIDTLATMISDLDKVIQLTAGLAVREEHKEMLNQLAVLNTQFRTESDKVIALIPDNPSEAKRYSVEVASPLAREIRNIADRIVVDQARSMEEGTQSNIQLVSGVIQTILLLSVISLLLAIGIAILISQLIAKPILALVGGAEKIAAGDLTQPDIQVKNRDEIGQLAGSFNQMKMNLRNLIREVGLNTDQVAATSEELSASAEQTSKATEQIAAAVQEVASGAATQVSSAAAATNAAAEITKGMNQAASSIQFVAELTTAANDKADAGNKVVAQTIEQMNIVRNSASETAEIIYTLGEKSKEISGIAELITSISTQTNLLALNASIEAARAGEEGRGFAVVAGEVRKLAEQSSVAAGQVRELIQEVQSETAKAVRSMNEGTSVVKAGIDMVHLTGQSFSEIAISIEQVAVESQEVSSIVEQVNASSQSMLEMMGNVARIAEQSAANSQNVASSSEEQTAAMEEVSASAEALSKMAQELQEAISKFKA
ncbi:methyl-accepting chemotaxis protein [Paenibacillus gorillae]|uniref:methyl-accepting chemotaxis protein n=1 Tax=Paenibacillus gorillae TaxID=1243662 RepID=UPI0004B78763|nr:methyl-accepting chemotaxis protein [Paenibacillus gorillae]